MRALRFPISAHSQALNCQELSRQELSRQELSDFPRLIVSTGTCSRVQGRASPRGSPGIRRQLPHRIRGLRESQDRACRGEACGSRWNNVTWTGEVV